MASAIAALASSARVGLFGAVGVGDLDVVGLVPGHHLVARDAVGHGVHDRPLRRRGLPAALGLLGGQFDDAGPAEVHLQPAVVDEDPRPDDLARLARCP